MSTPPDAGVRLLLDAAADRALRCPVRVLSVVFGAALALGITGRLLAGRSKPD